MSCRFGISLGRIAVDADVLDGTVIRIRLDGKATNISVLAVTEVRRDWQKVLLSIRNTGDESTAAWRQFLEDLDARGLRRPEFEIVDGASGLEAPLVSLWGDALPIQRCNVHSETGNATGPKDRSYPEPPGACLQASAR